MKSDQVLDRFYKWLNEAERIKSVDWTPDAYLAGWNAALDAALGKVAQFTYTASTVAQLQSAIEALKGER